MLTKGSVHTPAKVRCLLVNPYTNCWDADPYAK